MPKLLFSYKASGSLYKVVKGKVEATRADISANIVKLWKQKVMQSALSGRAKERYIEAIIPYKSPRAGAYIVDAVVFLLDRGWKRFDMKPGLLRGGRYKRVPLLPGVRTVSQSSNPNSWIHPGFKGAKIVPKVEKAAKGVIARVIANARK